MKRCRTCGKEKPLTHFHRLGEAYGNRRHGECRECMAANFKAWAEDSKRWVRRYCRLLRNKDPKIIARVEALVAERANGGRGLTPYYRLRHEAMLAYGGYRCVCCGEQEPMFLTLDHIKNGGTRERKEISGATNLFTRLRNKGYPPVMQVLCSNCNHGRYRNGGVCPHKKASMVAEKALQREKKTLSSTSARALRT